MNPLWGTIFNFILALGGAAESTGLTNILTTQGGKAGAVAATVIAVGNMVLHGISTTDAGPFVPMQPKPR